MQRVTATPDDTLLAALDHPVFGGGWHLREVVWVKAFEDCKRERSARALQLRSIRCALPTRPIDGPSVQRSEGNCPGAGG